MKSQPRILNYTTKEPVGRTIGEITTLLVRKGASAIQTDYIDGKPSALTFTIKIGDNMVGFRMSPNVRGVQAKLARNKSMDQAERVAWRIMLRWTEAQIALVESNQAKMGQVFLPYVVQPDGDTIWQAFEARNTKQLPERVQ